MNYKINSILYVLLIILSFVLCGNVKSGLLTDQKLEIRQGSGEDIWVLRHNSRPSKPPYCEIPFIYSKSGNTQGGGSPSVIAAIDLGSFSKADIEVLSGGKHRCAFGSVLSDEEKIQTFIHIQLEPTWRGPDYSYYFSPGFHKSGGFFNISFCGGGKDSPCEIVLRGQSSENGTGGYQIDDFYGNDKRLPQFEKRHLSAEKWNFKGFLSGISMVETECSKPREVQNKIITFHLVIPPSKQEAIFSHLKDATDTIKTKITLSELMGACDKAGITKGTLFQRWSKLFSDDLADQSAYPPETPRVIPDSGAHATCPPRSLPVFSSVRHSHSDCHQRTSYDCQTLQPSRAMPYRARERASLIGQMACIEQSGLPPLLVNSLREYRWRPSVQCPDSGYLSFVTVLMHHLLRMNDAQRAERLVWKIKDKLDEDSFKAFMGESYFAHLVPDIGEWKYLLNTIVTESLRSDIEKLLKDDKKMQQLARCMRLVACYMLSSSHSEACIKTVRNEVSCWNKSWQNLDDLSLMREYTRYQVKPDSAVYLPEIMCLGNFIFGEESHLSKCVADRQRYLVRSIDYIKLTLCEMNDRCNCGGYSPQCACPVNSECSLLVAMVKNRVDYHPITKIDVHDDLWSDYCFRPPLAQGQSSREDDNLYSLNSMCTSTLFSFKYISAGVLPSSNVDVFDAYMKCGDYRHAFNLTDYLQNSDEEAFKAMPPGWSKQLETFTLAQLEKHPPSKVYFYLRNFLRAFRAESLLAGGIGEFGTFVYTQKKSTSDFVDMMFEFREEVEAVGGRGAISKWQQHILENISDLGAATRKLNQLKKVHSDYICWKLRKMMALARAQGCLAHEATQEVLTTAVENPGYAEVAFFPYAALNLPPDRALTYQAKLDKQVIQEAFDKIKAQYTSASMGLTGDQQTKIHSFINAKCRMTCTPSPLKEETIEYMRYFLGDNWLQKLGI